MALLGPFSLAVLLNLTATNTITTSTCGTVDLEYFVKGLVSCPQDRFGANCDYRFTKSREYLPVLFDFIAPGDNVDQVLHRRKCASAWFQNWLCSLPPEERDLSGITVGKTILQRVMRNYDASINRRKNPKREVFSLSYLEKWKWKPSSSQACRFKGVDWGASKPEAWLVSDVCVAQEVPTSIPVSESFIKQGEDIVRSAVHTSVKLDDWSQGHSVASLWWAGQLTVNSLASFGRCSLLAARSLTPTTLYANTVSSRSGENMMEMKLKYMRSGGGGQDQRSVQKRAPQQRPSIAMHVRRGDSCMRWTNSFGDNSLKQGRPCFATDLYVKAAIMIRQKYGAKVVSHVNLATDSANASLSVASALQREGFSVTTLNYDRKAVGGDDSKNRGKKIDKGTVYIEDRLKEADPSLDPELVIGSLAAEMEMLSSSQFIVGTSSSWVTRLAFLAMIGRHGIIPPFIFLDSPFGCLNIKACAV